MPTAPQTYCRRGHEMAVVGRYGRNGCAECCRMRQRQWQADHPGVARERGRLDREYARQVFAAEKKS